MGRDSAVIANSGAASTVAPGGSETGACTGAGSVDLACHGCGSVHSTARVINLPDGRSVGSHSEQYRAWCEARWAMTLPDKPTKRRPMSKQKYLLEVQKHRGEVAAYQLRALMVKMWKSKR
jgi:hypothetical protein